MPTPIEADDLAPVILDLPLRTMLAHAEAGKINAVAILTASEDGSVGTCYAGAKRWADLLAACEVFRARLLADGV